MLTAHDKHYRVTIAFGVGTDTDDAEGRVTRTGDVPACVTDPVFAASFVAGLVGAGKAVARETYSAIKVNGKKSYEAARAGNIIDLAPRDIEVYEARLLEVREGRGDELPTWDVAFHVSKGTYIRALARDVGVALGCPAHVAALERTRLGTLDLEECVSLDVLAELKDRPRSHSAFGRALPVRAGCGCPEGGERLSIACFGASLYERRRSTADLELCACTSGVRESCTGPKDGGETVAVIADNKLVALYGYDQARDAYQARCVFQTGVSRGKDL